MSNLSELVKRARERAGMEDDETLSEEEWEGLIQDAWESLYDMIVTSWGVEHFAKKRSIGVVTGQTSYPLPTDCKSVLSMDWFDGQVTQPIRKWTFKTEHIWANQNTSSGRYAARVLGRTIEVRPTPSSITSEAIKLWYVPKAGKVGELEDVYSIDGWDLWIIVDAAQQALIEEGSTDEAAMLQQKKMEVEARIERLAPMLDEGPDMITDTQGWSEYVEYYDDFY